MGFLFGAYEVIKLHHMTLQLSNVKLLSFLIGCEVTKNGESDGASSLPKISAEIDLYARIK